MLSARAWGAAPRFASSWWLVWRCWRGGGTQAREPPARALAAAQRGLVGAQPRVGAAPRRARGARARAKPPTHLARAACAPARAPACAQNPQWWAANPQVLRIVTKAAGMVGHWFRPREAVVQRVLRMEEDGVYVLLFGSVLDGERDGGGPRLFRARGANANRAGELEGAHRVRAEAQG